MDEITPIEFATTQLEEAFRQHVTQENYIIAITLSGAAEEILGKMLMEEDRALQELKNRLKAVHTNLEKNTDKDIVNLLNRPKNKLKHGGSNLRKKDLKNHSIAMLARGLTNYITIFQELPPAIAQEDLKEISSNLKE